MKKLISIAILLLVSVVMISGQALAEGDKVNGGNATGPANQNGECPFTGNW